MRFEWCVEKINKLIPSQNWCHVDQYPVANKWNNRQLFHYEEQYIFHFQVIEILLSWKHCNRRSPEMTIARRIPVVISRTSIFVIVAGEWKWVIFFYEFTKLTELAEISWTLIINQIFQENKFERKSEYVSWSKDKWKIAHHYNIVETLRNIIKCRKVTQGGF